MAKVFETNDFQYLSENVDKYTIFPIPFDSVPVGFNDKNRERIMRTKQLKEGKKRRCH